MRMGVWGGDELLNWKQRGHHSLKTFLLSILALKHKHLVPFVVRVFFWEQLHKLRSIKIWWQPQFLKIWDRHREPILYLSNQMVRMPQSQIYTVLPSDLFDAKPLFHIIKRLLQNSRILPISSRCGREFFAIPFVFRVGSWQGLSQGSVHIEEAVPTTLRYPFARDLVPSRKLFWKYCGFFLSFNDFWWWSPLLFLA